jgi:hypothetical protein
MKKLIKKALKLTINSEFSQNRIRAHLNAIKFYAKIASPDNINESYDRNYVYDYLLKNKEFIHGDVLEFNGQVRYLDRKEFKSDNINPHWACGIKDREKFSDSDFFIDLLNKNTLPHKKFDCIICTQLLYYMLDGFMAISNLKYMLNHNGYLILTVPGPIFLDNNSVNKVFYTKYGLEELCNHVFKSSSYSWGGGGGGFKNKGVF